MNKSQRKIKREYAQRPYVKLKAKKYYQKNKKKILIRQRKYKQLPKVKIRMLVLEKTLKYKLTRIAYKKNTEIKIRIRLRARVYNSLKSYTKIGKIKKADEYGINYENIINHLKPFPKNLSKYHIDHIQPLCSFNLENPNEIKKAFAPENHQWLLAKENFRKSGRC